MSAFVEECRWVQGLAPLVFELVDVPVEPLLRLHGGLVEVVALITALTGLDEHDGPVEALSIGAGEGHVCCARATR